MKITAKRPKDITPYSPTHTHHIPQVWQGKLKADNHVSKRETSMKSSLWTVLWIALKDSTFMRNDHKTRLNQPDTSFMLQKGLIHKNGIVVTLLCSQLWLLSTQRVLCIRVPSGQMIVINQTAWFIFWKTWE